MKPIYMYVLYFVMDIKKNEKKVSKVTPFYGILLNINNSKIHV